jgi:hypothetical protein
MVSYIPIIESCTAVSRSRQAESQRLKDERAGDNHQ